MDYIVVLCTCKRGEAEGLADTLVGEGLAACVNMMDVKSVFRWKDSVERENETLLVIKSGEDKWKNMEKRIKEIHSYDTPEIIALPIKYGLDEYLGWIDEVTGGK